MHEDEKHTLGVLVLDVAVGKGVASGAARTMPAWPPTSSNVVVSRRF
jgi:hypothetical protein